LRGTIVLPKVVEERPQEVEESIGQVSRMVVEHPGLIAGDTNGVGFSTHTVANSNRLLMALLAAAPSFAGPGFFLPMTNFEVLKVLTARAAPCGHLHDDRVAQRT
jgi:hypothetical protein